MTLVWVALVAACSVSAALPVPFAASGGPAPDVVFFALIPLALLLGIGLPFTKKYPDYYQRKMGIDPVSPEPSAPDAPPASPPREPNPPDSTAQSPKEALMSRQGKIVAINGSPHGGIGNTSLMIEMFRPTLQEAGFDLEVITLHDKDIGYCTGCAVCIEKGKCWIPDDHRDKGAGRHHPAYALRRHVLRQVKRSSG